MMRSPGSPPRLVWGQFCDYFSIDAGGKYSLIGIFERIGAQSFPAIHRSLYIVCTLSGDPDQTGNAIMTIWTPDNNILVSTQESPIRFSNDGRTVLVNLLYDLNFPSPGEYSVVVEVNGRPCGTTVLHLYDVGQQQA